MLCSLLFLCLLALHALSAPSSKHVQHEKRQSLPYGWSKHGRLSKSRILPMRVALTQSNLDKGYDHLLDVSHPESTNYGKHWDAQQVAETFAPTQESVDLVTEWLESSGIPSDRISRSQSLGWLHFDATVGEAEMLLKTRYHLHQHSTGKPHVACDSYHIPEHLKPHIDFITPTIHFDTQVAQANPALEQRAEPSSTAAVGVPVQTKAALQITEPGNGFLPKKGAVIDIENLVDELEDCNTHITPNCLRALYRFPPGFTANPKNSFGITEFTPQAYLQEDLDLFFANFSRRQRQKTPDTKLINGAVVQTSLRGFAYNGESDLDLEYAMALVNPQNVTLYQVGDLVQGASLNNFLDAIDASYCTSDGGDDPKQDARYPADPSFPGAAGGYQGPRNCGGFAATKVISTSYGYNEADLTPAYEARQCNEYMKLGLQGTSFFFSSGDFGVAGNYGQCISTSNITSSEFNNTNTTTVLLNDGSSGKFNPAFPSTCPYVTSVGATQIRPGGSVFEPEEAVNTVVRSGGGFSNVFPLPSYQSAAVLDYFRSNPGTSAGYTAQQYNNSRATRAYPDISANGANYVVAVNGLFQKVYGSSASAPVVGSIFTLINEARLAVGKTSVGFVNPVLYANPGDLNDVVTGTNAGCGTQGFESGKGWDPVTGLGTPNFPRLLGRFLGLP